MNAKEKLMIALRFAFVFTLIVMLVWEFIEPNEDRFRSFIRIVLWFILLVRQVDYLITKFNGSGKST